MSWSELENFKPAYLVAAEALRKNPGQWKAYESTGNCVILAGPGSGKTKTLTTKLARILAEDVEEPRRVACITYNNECARELKVRLAALGVSDTSRAFIGTLHSFCLQHIVLPFIHLTSIPKTLPIAVATVEESDRLKEGAVDTVLGTNQRWGAGFDRYRRTHLDRAVEAWKGDDDQAAAVIEEYERLLDDAGLIDFDGMVLIGLHLVRGHSWVRRALEAKFPVLVVDEYQDLGIALDEIVKSLCFGAGIRLIAVGDPDQSIYGFTGAEPALLKELAERSDVEKIQLRRNYRCGTQIIRASQIALGEARDFESDSDEPGVIFFHEYPGGIADQVEAACTTVIPAALARKVGRSLGDVAVLYLDRNDGDVVAQEVGDMGWKFVRVDGNNPYQASPVTHWLEDCARWCAGAWKSGAVSLRALAYRWQAFNETLSTPALRRDAENFLTTFLVSHRNGAMPLHEWLRAFLDAGLQDRLDHEPRLRDDKTKVANLLAVCSPDGPLKAFTVAFFGGHAGSPEHIRLSTLHSAKGLEYDVVVMLGLEEGRIPSYNDVGNAVREKRRLFYVGLTRARHEVHLFYSGWYPNRFGRVFRNGRSRFVTELAAEMAE
jgi:DNA helicase II / ATP-dependent DNA helicase PcrA